MVALVAIPATTFAGEVSEVLGISNAGTEAKDEQILERLNRFGETRSWRSLGERDDVRFYAGERADGGRCYALVLSSVPTPGPSMLACQRGATSDTSAFGAFPSSEAPILDFSAFRSTGNSDEAFITRLAGIAADVVDRIGVVTAKGTTWFPVDDNIYASRNLPPEPVIAVVGQDRDGRRVYEKRLSP